MPLRASHLLRLTAQALTEKQAKQVTEAVAGNEIVQVSLEFGEKLLQVFLFGITSRLSMLKAAANV